MQDIDKNTSKEELIYWLNQYRDRFIIAHNFIIKRFWLRKRYLRKLKKIE